MQELMLIRIRFLLLCYLTKPLTYHLCSSRIGFILKIHKINGLQRGPPFMAVALIGSFGPPGYGAARICFKSRRDIKQTREPYSSSSSILSSGLYKDPFFICLIDHLSALNLLLSGGKLAKIIT